MLRVDADVRGENAGVDDVDALCAVNLEKVPQAKKLSWPLPIVEEEETKAEALPAEAWIS